MNTAFLDCLGFVTDTLSARGATVEREGDTALVAIPEPLARAVGSDEEIWLGNVAALGVQPVGFGTPLLEQCVQWARELVPTVCSEFAIEPPRPSQARSLAERFVVRNGVHELVDVTPGKATYSLFWFAWSVQCDDRYDGIIPVGLAESDASEPHAELLALVSRLESGEAMQPIELASPDEIWAAQLSGCAARRALRSLDEPVAPFVRSLERRKRRDHDRIATYFQELVADASSARRRGRVDTAALEKKVAHFVLERDKKLRDLDDRFKLRIAIQPAGLLRFQVPVLLTRLRLRRRKDERQLLLRLPAATPRLDRPACDACALPLNQPALCDDALHLLCESCVPEVRGRVACQACSSPVVPFSKAK